jgi:hypothetical protein
MVRITGPLFGTCATGKVAGVGSFRKTATGVSLVKAPPMSRTPTVEQRRIQECIAAAMRSWAGIHKYTRPFWPNYWAQWQIDHPECRGTTPTKPPKTNTC